MPSTIKIDIVSAEASIYNGVADMVFINGQEGELGVASGHAQLLTSLKPGYVRVKLAQSEEVFYISGGFAEIQPDIITILADTAERAQDLDEAAALRAREQAEKLLTAQDADIDYAMVLTQLAESAAQLQAIAQLRKKLR